MMYIDEKEDIENSPDTAKADDKAATEENPGGGEGSADTELDAVAAAQAEAAANWEKYLRSRAELENYRKRVQRDLRRSIRQGKRDLLLNLLEVIDNLERALGSYEPAPGNEEPGDGFYGGVEMIHRQLLGVLTKEGIAEVEAEGQPFDPNIHEAIAVFVSDEVSGDTVVDVIQRGYSYEDELLRPARVRVAKPGSPDETGQDNSD